MDESNVLDSGFLERMNTLLANGEVTPDVPCGSRSVVRALRTSSQPRGSRSAAGL